ncbi:unnamed protein product [Chrysodeixis includens]|uniref:Uncharacterized protein n=1 Tax=Chrysodeixis includens TaxID=689277 RepID=A0A9P0BZ66_CHRIL|nr:unnamed protein product [Chrysodeixis includens]
MSSTSSSDCDNYDYCQCGRSLDNNYSYDCYGRPIISSRHAPFCSAVGPIHPLIYYAEVHRPIRRQRCDQPRKENKNCFVKAFEWYTQERVPASLRPCPAAERCGFASWLDNKYLEYLRDSRIEQHVFQLTTQPTTTIDPCEDCPSQEPCAKTKKFARMKSPWRKRRRSCKDSGDVPENFIYRCLNQSCEFIMQPKDLTRAASDCCYPTPNTGCNNKSNVTVMSSNQPGTLRCTVKSHSMTSVCRETTQNPIDIIPSTVQEGSKTMPPTPPPPSPAKIIVCEYREKLQQVSSKSIKCKNSDVSCQCPEEKVVPVNVQTQYECLCLRSTNNKTNVNPCPQVPVPCCTCAEKNQVTPEKECTSKNKKKPKQVTVSCQCPEETMVTADTSTQYQPAAAPNECLCGARNIFVPVANVPRIVCPCATLHVFAPTARTVPDTKETQQVFSAPVVQRQSLTTVTVSQVDTSEASAGTEVVAKEIIVTKCTRSLTVLTNDAVQTSDHSICFERDGIKEFPLFMKIVCTDRKNNICF